MAAERAKTTERATEEEESSKESSSEEHSDEEEYSHGKEAEAELWAWIKWEEAERAKERETSVRAAATA